MIRDVTGQPVLCAKREDLPRFGAILAEDLRALALIGKVYKKKISGDLWLLTSYERQADGRYIIYGIPFMEDNNN